MILISILIPIYNGIEFLEECLLSIINQTYNNWEVIIGINGHPENSNIQTIAINIINKLNINNKYNIKINYYSTNGKPNTLNKMVNDSNGNFIAILDVDDYWHPNKLEYQIPYLNNYDIVGTQCKYFGDLNNSPDIPFGDISNFNIFSFNPIINSSVIIKKELANWNNEYLDDYDLWFKLFYYKKKFYNINKILTFHRIHNNSSFNNNNNNYVDELKKKWFNIYFNNKNI